jgi:hypothetical protein
VVVVGGEVVVVGDEVVGVVVAGVVAAVEVEGVVLAPEPAGDSVAGVEVVGDVVVVGAVVVGVVVVDPVDPVVPAVALAPGCSLATTTPMRAVAPVASTIEARVRWRTSAFARLLASGEFRSRECLIAASGLGSPASVH